MKFTTYGLERVGMELTAPFQIDVVLDLGVGELGATDDECVLEFHQIARILPGRRGERHR